jgi:hypothetical protein
MVMSDPGDSGESNESEDDGGKILGGLPIAVGELV